MKKKLMESFCLLLFTGILSMNAYLADRIHLPEKERAEIEKTTEITSNETTYDMEGLRNGLLAGMGNVSCDTDGIILEYTTIDSGNLTNEEISGGVSKIPDTHYQEIEKDVCDPSVEDTDIPKAESADLSQIQSNVPNTEKGCKSDMKTYMGYTAITCQSSDQYKLQKKAYTDKKSGIRMVDDYYLIAVGTYYADHIGEKLIVTMESGKQIPCMVGEFKSDRHTDKTHRYHVGGYENGIYYEADGSVIEFVVDTDIYKPKKKPKKFDGRIYAIHKEEE